MQDIKFSSVVIKPLFTGLILLNLAIISFSVYELIKGKQQAEKQAAINTQNLSQVLEKSISGLIDKIDLVLLAAADEIENQMVTGQVDERKLTAFLKRQNQRVPDIFNLRITDEHGVLRYGSDFSALPAVNYADRDYFLIQKDNPAAGLFIAKPVFGKTTKKWLLTISRRINKPNGAFAGVVYGTVSLEHFKKLFSVVDFGANGLIGLRDNELSLIANSQDLEPKGVQVGSKKISQPFAAALKKNSQLGTYISGATSIDRISRTHSYRKFEKYPLYVNTGVAEEVYLAAWRKQLLEAAGLIIVFLLSSAAFSYLLLRLLRRQVSYEKELERQAHIDYLTGVNNRGYFMEKAELELSRAIRYNKHLSMLMMDIDFFKQVNDSHGHKIGDAVLIKLAEICHAALREVDILGRVGGEEFAILLPETDKTEALEVAERLRAAIAHAHVPMAYGLPVQFTVSIGVASLSSAEDNLDVLSSRADMALYEAKNAGRNQVRAATTQS